VSTRYPPGLPEPPDASWDMKDIPPYDAGAETRAGVSYTRQHYRIDAADGPEAELRVLACLDRDDRHDPRGIIAEATAPYSPGRWNVVVLFPPIRALDDYRNDGGF
jgi:hypothetical protein